MTAPRPRPEMLTIQPYIAGELRLPGANRTIKLSSNEGAFGVPPSRSAAIARRQRTRSTAIPTAAPVGCERRSASAGASIPAASSAAPGQMT